MASSDRGFGDTRRALPERLDNDAIAQLVMTEYQSVAGLIKYFREVELKALGAAGLVLSVVAAAYAGLAAENGTTHDRAVLLAIAAWVPAVSLLVVLMATVRGFRAVVFMHDRVHCVATKLTGSEKVLAYEVHADDLFDRALEGQKTWLRVIVPWLVPGMPVMFLIASASLLLAALGCVMWPVTVLIGGPAALLAVSLATIGVKLMRVRRDYSGRAASATGQKAL